MIYRKLTAVPCVFAAAMLATTMSMAQTAPLRFAVSAGIRGELVPIDCGGATVHTAAFSTVASRFAGEPGAIVIDAGDLLGAAAVPQLLLRRDTNALAAAIAGAGYRALAVGHRDLSLERGALVAAARALNALGVPYVLSNLRCDAAHRALCEVVRDASDPPLVIDTPSGRVGIVSLVSPSRLDAVARDRATGLRLDPLGPHGEGAERDEGSFLREVRRARAAGATRVLVTLDGRAGHEEEEALDLASGHDVGEGPDVVVTQELHGGIASIETRGSGTPVVAAPSGSVVVIEPGAPRFARAARSGSSPAAVEGFVTGAREWLCANHGRTMPGGHLEAPLERPAFGDLVLDILRDRTHADVAVLNRGAIRAPSGLFPVTGGITPLVLSAALPFASTVHVARLTGAQLKALRASSVAGQYYFRGITADGSKVNGRDLDPTQTYQVVTTGYALEAVGDERLLTSPLPWRRFGTGTMQDLLTGWFDTPREGNILTAPSDPADHTRWNFRWTNDLSFSSVTYGNNSVMGTDPMTMMPTMVTRYSDPQLSRQQAINLRIDSAFRFDADNPRFTWDNEVRLRYGRAILREAAQGAPSVDSDEFKENLDLTTFTSSFTLRWNRRNRRWFHPLPTFQGYLETEVDGPPTPRSPDFHHLALRPTVGARFELHERVTMNLTGGIDWGEALAPESSNISGATPQFALVANFTARPGTLFTLRGRNVEGGLSVDYTLRDPGGDNGSIVRMAARIAIPLFEPLMLTLGYDLFGRNTAPTNEWAVAHDATVGLRIAFTRSLQLF